MVRGRETAAAPAPQADPEARRRISIFGATGSIGASTIAVLEARGGAARFAVEAVVAGQDAEGLAAAAIRLGARRAVVADRAALPALVAALSGAPVAADGGPEAVIAAAQIPVDWVMAAIVGVAGLAPTLVAAETGATIALANKETLVAAADPFFAALGRGGGALLPVDSEHSAVFQVFEDANRAAVEKVILTASGGPFRAWSAEKMAGATLEDALRHPSWSMGAKITIDSATMMNKGLEIIEAARLFQLGSDKIDVLVHPQSIVHSMVAYVDGSVLAQLGAPDMRTPIAYALSWPERAPAPAPRLDLASIGRLDFEPPDPARFPALDLARSALVRGGTAPAALNAANEAAVAACLERRLPFTDVIAVVDETMARVRPGTASDIEAVLAADGEARAVAAERINARGG